MIHRTCLFLACLAVLAAAEGPTYHQWRADGSGAGSPSPVPMVTDPARAKVVWTNDVRTPDTWPPGWANRFSSGIQGGYNSCSVAEGVAVITYFVPAGDFVEKVQMAKSRDKDKPERWLVDADDVILCIDARTGKTRWKAEMKLKGANHRAVGGTAHTYPVIHGGRVYAIGSLGAVYCLDLEDGKLVWESSIGKAHEDAAYNLKTWKADEKRYDIKWFKNKISVISTGRSKPKGLRNVGMQPGPPIMAGGTLVCPNSRGGLVGLDPKNGKPRWEAGGCLGKWGAPLLWRCGDRELVLAGAIHCIDPKNGKTLWKVNAPHGGPCIGALGKYAVTGGTKLNGGKGTWGVTGYAITAAGAKQIWQLGENERMAGYGCPVWTGGRCYVFVKNPVKNQPGWLYCIEPADGTVLAKVEYPKTDCVSPVACGDRIIYGNHLYQADPTDLKVLGRLPIKRAQHTTDPFAGGLLFAHGLEHVVCLDLRAK